MGIAIARATKNPIPRVPFSNMKDAVLGARYELSVAFVSAQKIRDLNRRYRKKNAPTDILSFGLSKHSGELYLCMPKVAAKAKLFGMTTRAYLGFLFIHGCLHLKDMDHGPKMEAAERRFCRRFGFAAPY